MCLFFTEKQIKQWYTSFRTQYGKLKVLSMKSGSGGRMALTAKKRFIWDNGKFLHNSFSHTGKTVSSFAVSTYFNFITMQQCNLLVMYIFSKIKLIFSTDVYRSKFLRMSISCQLSTFRYSCI